MEYSVLILIICLLITLFSTAIGSSFVFFFRKNFGPKAKSIILGFAGGIMVAAAFFGLLLPSIEQSKANNTYLGWSFVPPVVGFILGGLLLFGLDKIIPHFHKIQNVEEGPKNNSLSKNLKFFLAVSLACGLAISLSGDASIIAATSALSLAIGIGIQNIPEGAAVSIPMYGDGMSRGKAFAFGAASGIVEPIFAGIAIFLAQLTIINPWLLSLAAGAMIYVTLDEILPESREGGFNHFAMWSFMLGFVIMMVLEIVLS